jgi:hemolysin-activating ACP:hemolysin acyltransferase
MSIPSRTAPAAQPLNGSGSNASITGDIDVAMKDPPASQVSGSASPAETPGVGDGTPTALTESIRRQAATLRNSLAFAQVVGVLMRSPHYRQYTLADLEWLVIPPLSAGQFRIGEVKPDKNQGAAMPVAVVLWASVSEEVDKRLMAAESVSFRLKPEEWKSGDILWLVHAAGETRFVKHVIEQLTKTTLKGRQVKVLGRDKDGKPKVHLLDSSVPA